jgi:hypothetical protein
MSTWEIILIPVVLMVAGVIRQVLILRKKALRLDLATEFLNKFLEWCNGRAEDHSLYNWMLNKSETVQTMLGSGGLMHIRRPFESGYHPNVPVILSGIPEIQRAWHEGWRVHDQVISAYTQTIDGCLRRFIGSTEEQRRRERARLFNPLVLFCGGVAWLMELPLFILSETNIISTSRRMIIANGRLFSLLSGIGTIATLIATIMAIVMGWDRFAVVVTGWMK